MNAVNDKSNPVVKTGRTQTTTPYLKCTRVHNRIVSCFTLFCGVRFCGQVRSQLLGPALVLFKSRPVAEGSPLALAAPITCIRKIGPVFGGFFELAALVSF